MTQCCTVTIMHSDVHNTNNRAKHTYNSTGCQAPYFSVIIDQLLCLSVLCTSLCMAVLKLFSRMMGLRNHRKCRARIFITHCSNFIPRILTSKFFEANLEKTPSFLKRLLECHVLECHVIKPEEEGHDLSAIINN